MRKKMLAAITWATIWASGVQAAPIPQITFGPSDQTITFTGSGANSVTVSSPSLTGPAIDTTHSRVGSFTITPLDFITGPEVGGIFTPAANTETFAYVNPDDGDRLTESWHITAIQDDTNQPKFFGTGTITSISGDAVFLADFGPVGTIDTFDWIEMPLSCDPARDCTTLDQLAITRDSANAVLSSGENVRASAVPEPGSLAVLGGALCALVWCRRRRDSTV